MALHENLTRAQLREKRRERERRIRRIERAHDATDETDPPGLAAGRTAEEVRRIKRSSTVEDAIEPDVVER